MLFYCFIATSHSATPYDEAVRLLANMKRENARITDMRCTFTMVITKSNKRMPMQHLIFRYRKQPETIHLTFVNPHKGRKVVYVRGDKKMKVRPDGFWKFTTVTLDPLSDRAMEGSIDPVTAQGFSQIVSAAERLIRNSVSQPGYSIKIEQKKVDDSKNCIQLMIRTPESEEYILLVDSATFFPFQILKQTKQGSAIYTYTDIQVNPGMADSEFKL